MRDTAICHAYIQEKKQQIEYFSKTAVKTAQQCFKKMFTDNQQTRYNHNDLFYASQYISGFRLKVYFLVM